MAEKAHDQGRALRELFIEFFGAFAAMGCLTGTAFALFALTGWFGPVERLIASAVTAIVLAALSASAFLATGGQFNPLLSFAYGLTGRQPWYRTLYFPLAQSAGALTGAMAANNFAAGVLWQRPDFVLSGEPSLIAEWLGAMAIVLVAFATIRAGARTYGIALSLTLMGIFVATRGETLANPAFTFARCMTESGVGIRLDQLLPILLAQFGGAAAGFAGARLVFQQRKPQQ